MWYYLVEIRTPPRYYACPRYPDTYKFKMDWINTKREKMETSIFQTLKGSYLCGPWSDFKLIQALMYVIITCKYEKDPIKNN